MQRCMLNKHINKVFFLNKNISEITNQSMTHGVFILKNQNKAKQNKCIETQ